MRCRAKKFLNNASVVATPETCFGGNGCPECEYLQIRIEHNRRKLLTCDGPDDLDTDLREQDPEWAR